MNSKMENSEFTLIKAVGLGLSVDSEGEQSGLLTRIAATESVSLCVRMKSFTAIIEIKAAALRL